MILKKLTDQSLHLQLKNFVQKERILLTEILEHLQEVERRRLYCDFKRSSLFDYAVAELGYSEDQAHRRIQAMRLMKGLPEIKGKLSTGALSLTNAAKAQSLFRKAAQSSAMKPMNKASQLAVLKTIENKSTREAERELLKFQPQDILPVDRQKVVSAIHTELRVVVSQDTLDKLEDVRSLLGPKGIDLSHDELLQVMAEATVLKLKEKRFGKRRVQRAARLSPKEDVLKTVKEVDKRTADKSDKKRSSSGSLGAQQVNSRAGKNQRYLPASTKHSVWQRDQGRCCRCGSRRNLQFDHIKPVGLGGTSRIENLRLLCFSCNQRAGIRVYGDEAMTLSTGGSLGNL